MSGPGHALWQSLQILGNRLFMMCECEDGFEPERDWAAYGVHHPRIADWEALMGSVQVPPPESPDGSKWVEMKEISGGGVGGAPPASLP
jgi:hypothetical protein